MKRLIAMIALTTVLGVAACDDPQSREPAFPEPPMDAPIAPAAEDVSAPVAAPSAVDRAPVDTTTLPPEKRSSAESVQPDSETLFY